MQSLDTLKADKISEADAKALKDENDKLTELFRKVLGMDKQGKVRKAEG